MIKNKKKILGTYNYESINWFECSAAPLDVQGIAEDLRYSSSHDWFPPFRGANYESEYKEEEVEGMVYLKFNKEKMKESSTIENEQDFEGFVKELFTKDFFLGILPEIVSEFINNCNYKPKNLGFISQERIQYLDDESYLRVKDYVYPREGNYAYIAIYVHAYEYSSID